MAVVRLQRGVQVAPKCQGGGDGNATSSTDYVDANPANDRTTLNGYDWRDRPLWTMIDDHTPDPNNPGSTRKTYTFNTYDNLDDVLNVTRYYDLANTTGLPDNAPERGRSGHRPQRRGLRQPGAAVPVDRLQPERHDRDCLQHLVRPGRQHDDEPARRDAGVH